MDAFQQQDPATGNVLARASQPAMGTAWLRLGSSKPSPFSASPDVEIRVQYNPGSAGIQRLMLPLSRKEINTSLLPSAAAHCVGGAILQTGDMHVASGMFAGGALSSAGTYQHQHLQSWPEAIPLQHSWNRRQELNQRFLPMALPPTSRVEYNDSNSSVQGIADAYFQGGFALERGKCGAEYSNALANIQKRGNKPAGDSWLEIL